MSIRLERKSHKYKSIREKLSDKESLRYNSRYDFQFVL